MRARSRISTVLSLLAPLLCSCSTLFKPAVDQFSMGFESAEKAISNAEIAMRDVGRRQHLEHEFYHHDADDFSKDPLSSDLVVFANIVCTQSDSFDSKKPDLATLSVYRTTLQAINEQPKDDLVAILKSIRDHWKDADTLKPVELGLSPNGHCNDEVQNLIRLNEGDVPEFAPAAILALIPVFEAAKKLFEVVEKAGIVVLGIADDAVRSRKISAYVLASKDTVNSALNDLAAPDQKVFDLCQTLNFLPPCDKYDAEKPLPDQHFSTLDGVWIARKWAALREPWHTFLAMKSASDAYSRASSRGPKPDVATLRYLLDRQQSDLADQIGRYQQVASTPSSGAVARAMRKAQFDLERLANRDLEPGEAWIVLKEFADRAKKVANQGGDAKDAWNTLLEKIEAVGKGNGA